MDFDVLDLIDDAAAESNAFEKHPAQELSLEDQLHYLNGLALIMSSDKHIDGAEIEYINILIRSLSLDESLIDDVLVFAKAPDKSSVQAFFKSFRHKSIAQVFIFDALTMAFRDEELKEVEKLAIDKIAHQLGLMKGMQQDIFDLFCHIKHNNWEESALYFDSFLLKKEHFEHLVSYYGVDFSDLLDRTTELRRMRLQQLITGKMAVSISVEGKVGLSHDVVIPLLQAEGDRGLAMVTSGILTIKGNTNTTNKKNFAVTDFELSKYGIAYDSLSAIFQSEKPCRIIHEGLEKYIRNKYFSGQCLYGSSDIHIQNEIPTILSKTFEKDYQYITYQLSRPITREVPFVIWEGKLFKYEPSDDAYIGNYFEDKHHYSADQNNLFIEDTVESDKAVIPLYHSADSSIGMGSLVIFEGDSIRKISLLYNVMVNNEMPSKVINNGNKLPEKT